MTADWWLGLLTGFSMGLVFASKTALAQVLGRFAVTRDES